MSLGTLLYTWFFGNFVASDESSNKYYCNSTNFQDKNAKIGPWFRLIKENFLDGIWKSLDNLENVSDKKLHHMGECQ